MKSVTIPLRPVGDLTVDEIHSHAGVWILFGPTGRMTNLAWESSTLMKWIDGVTGMYVLKIPVDIGFDEMLESGDVALIADDSEEPC